MEYYGIRDNIRLNNTAITLGKFDGLHKGHQLLVEECVKSKEQGLTSVLFTFKQSDDKEYIYTEEEKRELVEQLGIDIMIVYPFDDKLKNMEANDFVRDILVDKFGAKKIVVGEDFCFGKDRKGNGNLLEELSKKYNYEIVIFNKKKTLDNEEITSTLIRNCILNSEVEKVRECLGRCYSIAGEIVKGKQLGRTIGFPTINIEPNFNKIIPCSGVYESEVIFKDNQSKRYTGITNVGNKPTIDKNLNKNIETYIFDFNDDVYGKIVEVYLKRYLRPERKFNSLDELKEAINKDKARIIN